MISGGCIAGILGLQSTGGLFFFFALQMIISIMQILQMKFNLDKYLVVSSVAMFFFRSAISEALTYVLFWALFYALVWIY